MSDPHYHPDPVDLAMRAGRYRRERDEARELIRAIATDWGDACDHADNCECSMARVIRYARQLEEAEHAR